MILFQELKCGKSAGHNLLLNTLNALKSYYFIKISIHIGYSILYLGPHILIYNGNLVAMHKKE